MSHLYQKIVRKIFFNPFFSTHQLCLVTKIRMGGNTKQEDFPLEGKEPSKENHQKLKDFFYFLLHILRNIFENKTVKAKW